MATRQCPFDRWSRAPHGRFSLGEGTGEYLIINQLSTAARCTLFSAVIKVANRVARSQKFPYRRARARALLPFVCIKRETRRVLVVGNDLIRLSRPDAGTNALLPLLLAYPPSARGGVCPP